MKPDSVAMASVITACANLGALQHGEATHAYLIRSGFGWDVSVGNALIDMYAKCGRIETACQCFDKMSKKDVSWTSMIGGFSQNGYANKAIALFCQMPLTDVIPNSVTAVSVLPACAHLSALEQGRWNHGYNIRNGLECDVSAGNALIDMYAKCGSVETAHLLFDKLHNRDVVPWNTMITGYGMHGYGEDALALFNQMQQTPMKPDYVTFTGVLSHGNMLAWWMKVSNNSSALIEIMALHPGWSTMHAWSTFLVVLGVWMKRLSS